MEMKPILLEYIKLQRCFKDIINSEYILQYHNFDYHPIFEKCTSDSITFTFLSYELLKRVKVLIEYSTQ